MGQKVHPIGLRVGVIRTWDSRWYAKGQQYFDNLHEDIRLRKYLKDKLKHAGVAKIEMERAAKKIKVIISTARPGVVIGKKGTGIDSLKAEVQKLTPNEVFLSIQEVRKPDLDAQLVAESVAQQLERRIMFRRAMKRAVANAMRLGALGVKIQVSGRLNGAEIARSEWTREGRVPLHTLRANIDYGLAEAQTTYGVIGIKVWIFKGEVFGFDRQGEAKAEKAAAG